jgi:hypothetical protein
VDGTSGRMSLVRRCVTCTSLHVHHRITGLKKNSASEITAFVSGSTVFSRMHKYTNIIRNILTAFHTIQNAVKQVRIHKYGDMGCMDLCPCKLLRSIVLKHFTVGDLPVQSVGAVVTNYTIGFKFSTICSLRCSRNGGSTIDSPRVSGSSSTANPGPSVAISNKIPFGSLKYRLRK